MYLLREISYAPVSAETKTVSSTTAADADATNLVATFTPDTSRVFAVLEANTFSGGTAPDAVVTSWNLRDSGGDLFAHQPIARTIERSRGRLGRIISVTAGQEVSWKWGLRSSSATLAANIVCGGTGGSANGPATMRFYSIAEGTSDLLALVQYNPDPGVTISTSSASYVDVDSANLAASFTHTGDVLVELEAYCSRRQGWTLRKDTTNLTYDGVTVGTQAITGNIPHRITIPIHIEAAGAETWKWGFRRVIDTAELYAGTDLGVAEMRVWAVG